MANNYDSIQYHGPGPSIEGSINPSSTESSDKDLHQTPSVSIKGSDNSSMPELESNQSLVETDKPYTTYQKTTFIGMCCAYLFSMMSFSIIAPFFPLEAEDRHVSHTQVGLIFAIYNLVSFITCPIWGKLIPVIGVKFTFLSGCWLAGGSNIVFGFLDQLQSDSQFLIFCYITRSLEAVGAAACMTAAMAIVANAFPDNIAQVMGWMEVFSGLGYAIGPPIGGALYGIGGYKLPFIVIGGASLLIMVINIFVLPEAGSQDSKKMGSFTDLLRIPSTWPIVYAILCGSAALSFLDPTLSPHLKQFDLSPTVVGLIFLILGSTYALFSPLWGYIADKKKATRLMIVLGFHAAAVAYLLMGPSPILKLPNELWIICLGLGLLGVAIGCGIVPTFLDLLSTSLWYGMKDDLSTQSVVSGLFNSCFSLGAFIGPFVGGTLVDQVGFPWAATYFGCANLTVVFVVSLFGIWEFRCGLGKRKPRLKEVEENEESLNKDAAADETTPLIPEAPSWE